MKEKMDYKNDPLITQLNKHAITMDNEFWIMLFLVLCIFGFGFIVGNIAHDSCCHVIEQLQH